MNDNNTIRVADATKAFLQAELMTLVPTYVELPPEMWLEKWDNKYRRPTVRLMRALYGHPQASVHWDLHLRQILINDLGSIPVDGHPSVFFHESWRILVVVYVDDILASGPSSSQDLFWKELKSRVQLDDVEELSQFLGRFHHMTPGRCVFDMRDYATEAVNLYLRNSW